MCVSTGKQINEVLSQRLVGFGQGGLLVKWRKIQYIVLKIRDPSASTVGTSNESAEISLQSSASISRPVVDKLFDSPMQAVRLKSRQPQQLFAFVLIVSACGPLRESPLSNIAVLNGSQSFLKAGGFRIDPGAQRPRKR